MGANVLTSNDNPAPLWDANRLQAPHQQADKARRVRGMFDAIAPTYERVNTLFSLGRDRAWRKKAVALAKVTPHDTVLDVACGTGDFARAFADCGAFNDAQPAHTAVVGCDFSQGMLTRAAARPAPITWLRADALRLPFPDASFSIASCAFGVRNFQDLDLGLSEFARVLTDAGRAVILEFTQPKLPGFRRLYEFYANRLMPRAASWISRDTTGAYSYLPKSVAAFIDAAEMTRRLQNAGFTTVRAYPRTFGVVTIYLARKSRAKSS
jgi:demethylmenaquinone methyltransferase/2-methoxy-6-polyprenyl-1,4-benzoquinol methylase